MASSMEGTKKEGAEEAQQVSAPKAEKFKSLIRPRDKKEENIFKLNVQNFAQNAYIT